MYQAMVERGNMKVAIDKSIINQIKDFNEFEYIYIFDNEPIKDLLKTNLHCVNKNYVDYVDINLTKYNINCLKCTTIKDKDWKKAVEKRNYKFAIIVPNCNNDHGEYNGKTFFRNCIDSILGQTYENFELIIVDDMSTDTSVETVKSYNDKRIHLIQNNRKRYNGGSRNVGIDYAKTTDADYICFLDSDDWWKHKDVLKHINDRLFNHEMMFISTEMLHSNGTTTPQFNKYDNYEDVFISVNKVWCTAWCRIIRIDKIVYFCEDTLMEDRVWSYKQADNVSFDRITRTDEICYVWNRTNTNNSVSQVRGGIWNASAYCHIGHQLMLLETIKHKELKPILEQRIETCKQKVNTGTYQQY